MSDDIRDDFVDFGHPIQVIVGDHVSSVTLRECDIASLSRAARAFVLGPLPVVDGAFVIGGGLRLPDATVPTIIEAIERYVAHETATNARAEADRQFGIAAALDLPASEWIVRRDGRAFARVPTRTLLVPDVDTGDERLLAKLERLRLQYMQEGA